MIKMSKMFLDFLIVCLVFSKLFLMLFSNLASKIKKAQEHIRKNKTGTRVGHIAGNNK